MIGCSATMEKLRGEKAQPKLLHVTETLTVDRIGGRTPIPVDFRLIVATNRNLEEMVRQGTFRDDLYDRLNMFSIWVPPLRARLEDIPLLVDYFISDCVGQAKRLVTGAAQQVLDLFQQYSWPGNIRELRNVVKRGCLHRQNRMDPPGRLTIRFCAAAGNPLIEARRP